MTKTNYERIQHMHVDELACLLQKFSEHTHPFQWDCDFYGNIKGSRKCRECIEKWLMSECK